MNDKLAENRMKLRNYFGTTLILLNKLSWPKVLQKNRQTDRFFIPEQKI